MGALGVAENDLLAAGSFFKRCPSRTLMPLSSTDINSRPNTLHPEPLTLSPEPQTLKPSTLCHGVSNRRSDLNLELYTNVRTQGAKPGYQKLNFEASLRSNRLYP